MIYLTCEDEMRGKYKKWGKVQFDNLDMLKIFHNNKKKKKDILDFIWEMF